MWSLFVDGYLLGLMTGVVISASVWAVFGSGVHLQNTGRP